MANSDQGLIWENDWAAAFADIHPKAPIHILVVPKRHITNLDELDDAELAGHLLLAVREVAQTVGLSGAYRVGLNNGKAAGQVIEHLHFHLMGRKAGQNFSSVGVESDLVQ